MFTPPPLRRTLHAALRDLASKRAEVRASAARDLASTGDADPLAAAEALVPLLRDPDSRPRGEAAMALGALGARTHADAVGALLGDPVGEVRQYAAMALGAMGGARAVALLDEGFAAGAPEVRFQALLALAAAAPARGLARALEAVGDADVWIASEAAALLAALLTGPPDAEFAPNETQRAQAREALRPRVAAGGRVGLRAALALLALGDRSGASAVVDFVRGAYAIEPGADAAELRLEAIDRLAEVDLPEARVALEGLAWRMLPSIEREPARAALARQGDERARRALLERLGGAFGRRDRAVHLAGVARLREAVPALLALLAAGRADAHLVVDALAAIGGPDARAALERVATNSAHDEHVRVAARAALTAESAPDTEAMP